MQVKQEPTIEKDTELYKGDTKNYIKGIPTQIPTEIPIEKDIEIFSFFSALEHALCSDIMAYSRPASTTQLNQLNLQR